MVRPRDRTRRWALAGAAAVAVLAARGLLHVAPFRSIRRLGSRIPSLGRNRVDAQEIAWAVATVARALRLRNSCLPEAIAAHALLRVAGISSELRFEVARHAGRAFEAHASVVTAAGIVLGPTPGEDFAALESVPLSPRHV